MENLPEIRRKKEVVVVVVDDIQGRFEMEKRKRKDYGEALLDSLCYVTIANLGFVRI